MSRTLLQKIDNYLVATDVDSNKFAFTPQPTKHLRYELIDETVFFYGTDINHNTRFGNKAGYLVGLTGTVDLTGGGSGAVDGIQVNLVEIMSGAENFDTNLTVTAANVAANINANTSTPNYSATSSGTLITIQIVSIETSVDAFTVTSSATTITTTDVDMGVDTGNLEKSAGTLFISLAELLTFLRANTGA